MTAALALLGVLATVGVGYALGRVDRHDQISDLEAEVRSLRDAHRDLLARALRSATRFGLPAQPPAPWPNPIPRNRITEPPPVWPEEPPLQPLSADDTTEAPGAAESATQAIPEPTGEPQTETWSVPR